MNTITRKAAPSGFVYQVIAGADMASDLSEARAREVCESIGGVFPAALAEIAARPATTYEHISVGDAVADAIATHGAMAVYEAAVARMSGRREPDWNGAVFKIEREEFTHMEEDGPRATILVRQILNIISPEPDEA